MKEDRIQLSEPDVGERERALVAAALGCGRLSGGPLVEAFESMFADWVGRQYAVAVASGTIGTWLALRAAGIGPGDEVVAPAYAWHQVAHAITLAGATPVFADIEEGSACLSARKAAACIGPATKAVLAGNTNGHPAAWRELRELADARRLLLIEDSTEAVGSRYLGRLVGGFGDVAVFDFSQPGALCCGEGGMVVTDDPTLASELAWLRERRLADRASVSVGARVPLQAGLGELAAGLGIAQLERIDEILARRKHVEGLYRLRLQSFEGIDPPWLGPDIDEVHWMLYVVRLGGCLGAGARAQIVDDLDAQGVEAAAVCTPLHQQVHYEDRHGCRRGQLPDTEHVGDRALALPLHAGLDDDAIACVVEALKDSATNVGAGAAIHH